MQPPRQREVHRQQRQSHRNHPVADHRQEAEETGHHQQDADGLAYIVVLRGLECVELPPEKIFHAFTIQVYLTAGKR